MASRHLHSEKSLAETTAAKIMDLIKQNNIQTGEKLPTEPELTKMFGVGRSTIREAVKALVSRNVLVVRQGAGTFVSELGGVPDDPLGLSFLESDYGLALDMIEFRYILEPETAALAAIHATEEQRRLIIAACDECENLMLSGADYHEQDSAFHEAIARASGNTIINKVVQVIHASIQKNIYVTADSLREFTIRQHRIIAEAVFRGDEIGAKAAMAMHMAALRQCVFTRKQAKSI